ncbi:MAG: glutaredoxin family protein [Patescibacteria group bacterium]
MERVTVYTTPTCPWCTEVKNLLQQKGIEYREVDVAGDREGAREMLELTGQRSVPVTLVGREIVVGFDRDRLESLLSS